MTAPHPMVRPATFSRIRPCAGSGTFQTKSASPHPRQIALAGQRPHSLRPISFGSPELEPWLPRRRTATDDANERQLPVDDDRRSDRHPSVAARPERGQPSPSISFEVRDPEVVVHDRLRVRPAWGVRRPPRPASSARGTRARRPCHRRPAPRSWRRGSCRAPARRRQSPWPTRVHRSGTRLGASLRRPRRCGGFRWRVMTTTSSPPARSTT